MTSPQAYRLFSSNENGYGAECPACGRVLKVARVGLVGTDQGFRAPAAVRCVCGFQASDIVNSEPKAPAAAAMATKPTQRSNVPAIVFLAVVILLLGLWTYHQVTTPYGSSPAAVDTTALAQNSKWDGSVYWVTRYLKQNLKDPGSYQPIDWSAVKTLADGKMMVRHKYRAKNSFGGYVISNQVFIYDRSGKVYSVIDYR